MNDMSKIESATADEALERPRRRARRRLIVMLAVPVLILALGLYFWATGGRTVSTDNAEVNAHVVSVAPEVGGKIVQVAVAENQQVKAGDLLYRIDPAPFRIALLQADAAVGNARLEVAQLQGGYASKVASVGTRGSDVLLAQQNYDRQAALLAKGFTTRANFDAARAALNAARSDRAAAQSDAAAAAAMVGTGQTGGHPQIEAAMAVRDKAALDLARTTVRAPIDGVISQTDRLNVGQLAVQMLSNVSVVGGGYWIEANFKETQLARIRVGQPAQIELDAIPGRTFRAHVSGIGAGTGAQFALLPAQNATGNWVKVTQRVPVRLTLDDDPGRPLVAGWSAHVTIEVR